MERIQGMRPFECHRYFFLRFYLFLDRGEGREKERERNIHV